MCKAPYTSGMTIPLSITIEELLKRQGIAYVAFYALMIGILSASPLLSGDYHINGKSEKCNFRPVNVQDIRDALAKAKISKSFGNEKYLISF